MNVYEYKSKKKTSIFYCLQIDLNNGSLCQIEYFCLPIKKTEIKNVYEYKSLKN